MNFSESSDDENSENELNLSKPWDKEEAVIFRNKEAVKQYFKEVLTLIEKEPIGIWRWNQVTNVLLTEDHNLYNQYIYALKKKIE